MPHFNKLMEMGADIRADSRRPGLSRPSRPSTAIRIPSGTPLGTTAPRLSPLPDPGAPPAAGADGPYPCLPRQDMQNGFIKEYRVEASDDGKTWRVLAHGRFARNHDVEDRALRPAGQVAVL